jgi:hypothetical protein
MEDDEFRRGAIEIQWLERRLPSLLGAPAPEPQARIAAIAAALLVDRERAMPRQRQTLSTGGEAKLDGWKRAARVDGQR